MVKDMERLKLEEYLSKKAEIKELREKLDNLDKTVVSDTVLDYRSGYPHPVTITGIDTQRISRMRSLYITSIMRIENECAEVEEWVETITDSLSRRIVRMFFLDGMTQSKIAYAVHMDQSAVSKKIKKVLDTM